ncbi:MAG: sulfite exporter TauE/SafE family protein [Anaerolineae bacterium]|nr:sulfite exporter TauE/SafE family protein [Anaerolineae bacterium]
MLASALTSVAGGGSFISFPALLVLGIPPVNANTTNTVALWPGSVASVGAYRREFATGWRSSVPLLIVSLCGGILGALLLLQTSQDTFAKLLPFLLAMATLLLAFSPRITQAVRSRNIGSQLSPRASTTLVLMLQFAIAVYGGFFGGGIGIMMLAMMSLQGMTNIHAMNGVKTLLAVVINGLAVATFVLAGTVYWPQCLVLLGGAILGGYGGAYLAQRFDSEQVRKFVIAIGMFMTVYFFARTYVA